MSGRYPKEPIPDSDHLYLRIHKANYRDGNILPVAFNNHGMGMSTDWSYYSTPEETRNRVVNFQKDPNNFGVVNLPVGSVREIRNSIVEHTPQDDNQAHTDVFGEKTPEVRILLRRISVWEIPIPKD